MRYTAHTGRPQKETRECWKYNGHYNWHQVNHLPACFLLIFFSFSTLAKFFYVYDEKKVAVCFLPSQVFVGQEDIRKAGKAVVVGSPFSLVPHFFFFFSLLLLKFNCNTARVNGERKRERERERERERGENSLGTRKIFLLYLVGSCTCPMSDKKLPWTSPQPLGLLWTLYLSLPPSLSLSGRL